MKQLIQKAAHALRPASSDAFAPLDKSGAAPRYFIVSPYKTATTTVGRALITLGAGKNELTFRRNLLGEHRTDIRALGNGIAKDAGARDWIASNSDAARRVLSPFHSYLNKYDVFSDAPFGHWHVHCFVMKAAVPGARFIWFNRPFEDWIASVRAWETSHPEMYPRHVDWDKDPEQRATRMRRRRRRHHREFRRLAAEYPQDCLELSPEDLKSWDKIAAFCGLPAPDGAPVLHNVSSP